MQKNVLILAIAFVGLLTLADTFVAQVPVRPVAGAGGDNSLFDYLASRRDLSVCRSYRPDQSVTSAAACHYKDQLKRTGGGDLNGQANQEGLYVSYDYARDTDPERQDAARVTIPAFMGAETGGAGTLETSVSASSSAACNQTLDMNATSVDGKGVDGYYGNPGDVRVGDEIMRMCDPDGAAPQYDRSTKVLYVKRAQYGTKGASHSAGAVVRLATVSLQTQLRTTVNLDDGETGLFYWEFYLTSSFMAPNWTYKSVGGHKTWHLYNGSLFIEPQTDYSNAAVGAGIGARSCYNRSRHAFNARMRPYHRDGGNVHAAWAADYDTETGPGWQQISEDIQPTRRGKVTEYCGLPSRWHRAMLRFQNVANDWDVIDYWLWDKDQNPVRLHASALVGANNWSGSPARRIRQFWQEWNASEEFYHFTNAAGIDDYVRAYIKNFVMLKSTGAAAAGSLSDAEIAAIHARPDIRPTN